MTNPKKSTNTKSKGKNQVSRGSSAPAARGTQLQSSVVRFKTMPGNSKMPGSIRIQGHEFVTAVSATPSGTGVNLVTFLVSPANFSNTRLRQYAQLYDKFLFRKLRFHYASAQPTSATGQYILAYDRDFADSTPPATSAGVSQYFTMMNSKISNVWESSLIECPLSDLQDFYYTNNTGYEGRLVYQGQFYMAQVSGTAFTGSIWVEYDIDLFDPQLEGAFNNPGGYITRGVGTDLLITTGSGIPSTKGFWTAFNGFTGEVFPAKGGKRSMGFFTQSAGSSGSNSLTGMTGLVMPPGGYLFSFSLPNLGVTSARDFDSGNDTELTMAFHFLEVTAAQSNLIGANFNSANEISTQVVKTSILNRGAQMIDNSGSDQVDTAEYFGYITVPNSASQVILFIQLVLNKSQSVTTGNITVDIDQLGLGRLGMMSLTPVNFNPFNVFNDLLNIDLTRLLTSQNIDTDSEKTVSDPWEARQALLSKILSKKGVSISKDDEIKSTEKTEANSSTPISIRKTSIIPKHISESYRDSSSPSKFFADSSCCDVCKKDECSCCGGPYVSISRYA